MPAAEDTVFEIHFYEGIVDKAPLFTGALILLGDLYTKDGQYEKGLAIDKRLAVLCPDDPVVLYNLGCSYSLTGKIDQAFETVKRAVDCGYTDFTHLIHDPDLENLLREKRFRCYLEDEMKRCASADGKPSV